MTSNSSNNSQVQIDSQVQIVGIPDDVNIHHIYNPRFHLMDLISTRRNPFSSTRPPPRPPNSFFLMKNCYMLELRLLGYRFAMPDLCRQAKQIWREIPQDVKDRYDNLALQAQILHQEMYPNYRFSPKRRNAFKPYIPVGMNNAFTVTSVGGLLNEGSSPSSFESSPRSVPSPPQPVNDIYLVQPEIINFFPAENDNNNNNNNNNSGMPPEFEYFPDPSPVDLFGGLYNVDLSYYRTYLGNGN